MLCGGGSCNCVFTSTSLSITQIGNVITIEQAEFEDIEQLREDVDALELEMAAAQAQISSLETDKVDRAGDTMSGDLTFVVPSGGSRNIYFVDGASANLAAISADETLMRLRSYVGSINLRPSTGGDKLAVTSSQIEAYGGIVVTGVNGQKGQIALDGGTGSMITWWDGVNRRGYIQGNASDISVVAAGDLVLYGTGLLSFRPGGSEKARMGSSGEFLIGKTSTAVGTPGAFIGGTVLWMTTNDSVLSASPYLSNIVGTADVNGKNHFRFMHSSSTVGTIARVNATTIAYNTTSDERLKQIVEDFDRTLAPETAAYLLELILPTWFRWTADGADGPVICGDIAQDVARLWPGAIDHGLVTPGEDSPEDEAAWRVRHEAWERRARVASLVEARNERAATPWSPVDVPAEELNPYRPWSMDQSKWMPIVRLGWAWLKRRLDAEVERNDRNEKRLDRLEEAIYDPEDALEI